MNGKMTAERGGGGGQEARMEKGQGADGMGEKRDEGGGEGKETEEREKRV